MPSPGDLPTLSADALPSEPPNLPGAEKKGRKLGGGCRFLCAR